MRITQLRNATAVVGIGTYNILVDPMLAPKGALPPLKLSGARQRNPIADLPEVTDSVLDTVTHCLITHCQKGHFDHLDRAGKRWLRARGIPVICSARDAQHLRQRGLNVHPLAAGHLQPQPFLGGQVTTVPCRHGRGMVGLLMEHGAGYHIEYPGEPSLYLSGDTVLTPDILAFIRARQPGVSLIPAGGAKFDIGGEIIMGVDEAIAFTQASSGRVVANHLQALSHCPATREELKMAAARFGVANRLFVPDDGEALEFAAAPAGDCRVL